VTATESQNDINQLTSQLRQMKNYSRSVFKTSRW